MRPADDKIAGEDGKPLHFVSQIENITKPGGSMDGYTFNQLVDLTQVRQLLESHHSISGMPYGIFDTDENNLVAVGWQEICVRFHRVNPVSCARCRESDGYIKAHLHDFEGDFLEYRCKNGMIDIAMPIIIDGEHMATFFTGQFFYDDDLPDTEFFHTQAKALGFDLEEYLKALERSPILSRENVRNNVRFMCNLVKILAEIGLNNIKLVCEVEERTQIEEELYLREQEFRTLVENSPDPVIRYGRDAKRIYVNPAFEKLMGNPAALLTGKTPSELSVGGDDVSGRLIHQTVDRVLKNGRPAEFELSWAGNDGAQCNYHVRIVPEFDRDDTVISALCIGRDITEVKRTETALRESERKYRMLVETLPAVVFRGYVDWTVDFPDNRIESLTGYCKEEFDTRRVKWSDLILEEDFEKAEQVFQKALRGDGQYMREYRIKGKSGELVWVQDRGRVISDRDGGVAYVSGVIFNISEQKRLEDQFRHVQKMEAVGRLAGGVAHDFNNLLTVILGYTNILLNRIGDVPTVLRDLNQILKAGELAASLTKQLLAFSRKQLLQPDVLDLNKVLAVMEPMLKRLIGEDVDLECIQNPSIRLVKADPGQIEQVIMNLAINARDAMPKGGKLTIETANVELSADYARLHEGVAPGGYVLLAVSDTGHGMDEKTILQIFEPFFTTKEPGKGTGLGLSTVFGIVKQSGGHIWVYSEPEQGTTFKIYLPRHADGRCKSFRSETASEQSPVKGSETILLVEDHEAVRALAGYCLRECGYTVLEACHGEEAIRISAEHQGPVELVITDVVMPGMNGCELAKQLECALPGLKVLYMSGYSDNAVVHHAIIEEGAPFLQKPFTTFALAEKVREVLDTP